MIKRLTKCAVQESNLQPTDSNSKLYGRKTRHTNNLAQRFRLVKGVSSGRTRPEVATKSQSEPLGVPPFRPLPPDGPEAA